MFEFLFPLAFCLFRSACREPEERKAATQFRTTLLKSGFGMKPWSIYSKYFLNRSQAEASADNIGHLVPSMGKESMMFITDKQFALVRNYSGGALDELEKNQTNWPSFD